MTGQPPHHEPATVLVVGAGFAGMAAVVKLREAGIHDVVVLERADRVGGTWRDNTYPGAACDVPSHLYSFSFALNRRWSRSYSEGPEIQAYLERTADRLDITPHVHFGREVQEATWDDEAARWRVQTSQGTYEARFLVSASGGLSTPKLPDIAGIERFQGTMFHSARWNHEHDLTGERVAVIGTGASAVQFVPRIQPAVESLHVFQRTPAWVLPQTDRRYTTLDRLAQRLVPGYCRAARAGIWASREAIALAMTRYPRALAILERLSREHLRRQIPDRELRRALTPDFRIGCKRILLSNDWYPTLTRPNVELVTTGIREIREHSIVTDDGTERPVDTIILGTGFRVTDLPSAEHIRGREGQTLAEYWAGSVHAYRCTTVPTFPNLLLSVGPNSGPGHTSQVFYIESQLNYLVGAIRHALDHDVVALEPRLDATEKWHRQVQSRMPRTVWLAGGCNSWYLDDQGRNVTLWPGFSFTFRRALRTFDPAAYRMVRPPVPTSGDRQLVGVSDLLNVR